MPKKQQNQHEFEADVSNVMKLVAKSLYSHPEVFLRELISNASDALEKARLENISNGGQEMKDPFQVTIKLDKEKKQITISDNGIGMDEKEIIECLGKIAHSGTSQLIKNLEQQKDQQLIGQFGVGFYSTFIVASHVKVTSRKIGDDSKNGVCWSTDTNENFYELEKTTKETPGTDICLTLKSDHEGFCDAWRLKSLVSKYSDFISFPIMMQQEASKQDDDKDTESKAEDQATEPTFEQINHATALWTRSKSDITEDDYKSFYKHISHDSEDPSRWIHFKIEGTAEFSGVLYLPSKAPWDLSYRDKRQGGLKLFVQRVFIMDEADQLIPIYLRFVKGIIDSSDLPLNVSREILQSSKITQNIKQTVTKRVLSMLEDMAADDVDAYQSFWNTFGQVLKEGIGEDFANKDRLVKLMRFSSTHDPKSEQTVSIQDYVSRMPESQKKIYYITADSFDAAQYSPHLEVFKKKGIEVLLMHEPIDEWLVSHLNQFEEKEFESIAKGDLSSLDGDEADQEKKALEEKTKEFDSVLKQAKGILSDQVKDVQLSKRLTDSPSCLTVGENGMSNHLKRMLQDAGQQVPDDKPVLELNPEHSFVARLQTETSDDTFEKWVNFLYGQAVISESGQLSDPVTYIKSVNRLLEDMV